MYSAMDDNCRLWRTDQDSERLLIAKVSGLWSVNIVNVRTSRKQWNLRTHRWTASSSRSKVLYFCSGGLSCRLKKTDSRHWLLPMSVLDASNVSAVQADMWGWDSIVTLANACFVNTKSWSHPTPPAFLNPLLAVPCIRVSSLFLQKGWSELCLS